MRFPKVIASIIAMNFVAACDGQEASQEKTTMAAPSERLAAHSEEFRKDVIEVTDGVWVAVGYALANTIMIEGDDGIIIVDTSESMASAREVRAAFEQITSKPVKAIIYTHNHADHIMGTAAFVDDPQNVPVYAHATTEAYINRFVNIIQQVIFTRSARMFGTTLPADEIVNAGIGPFLGYTPEENGLLRPTHTFQDTLDINVAGVEIQLIHMPGETNDQIAVWLPGKKVLLPADNFYRAFPNLYTIRGTLYRDVREWARSIDKMLALEPEYLVPSHTRPLTGWETIKPILTDYRDAIQFVHDQTIRWMNKGLTPDEIVEKVHLPTHLAANPWLDEFYGTVRWSVRNIFNGYLGWFDGNAANLDPLPLKARAERLQAALQSGKTLSELATTALDEGDLQWAAELADMVLALNPGDGPKHSTGRKVRAAALAGLASQQVSAAGHYYYLTQAHEAAGDIEITPAPRDANPRAFAYGFPVRQLISGLTVRLKAEEALETDTVAVFHFPDVNETYALHVYKGVARFSEGYPDRIDIHITTNSTTWKDLVFQFENVAVLLATGDIAVDDSTLDFLAFMGLFETD